MSRSTIAALAAASAVGGGLAGVHPTGTPVVDPLYGAALGALVPLATSRANRASALVLAAVAVIMSRGWLWVPSGAALIVAFAATLRRHQRQRVGALVGALAVQSLLRWPHVGFQGATALVAAGALLPCLWSGGRELPRLVRGQARGSVTGSQSQST